MFYVLKKTLLDVEREGRTVARGATNKLCNILAITVFSHLKLVTVRVRNPDPTDALTECT